MNQIQHKCGASFKHEVELSENFSGYKVSSQLRKLGNSMPTGLIANLAAEIVTTDGKSKVIVFYEDTSSWPDCDSELDIKLSSEGAQTVVTPTVVISLIGAITR